MSTGGLAKRKLYVEMQVVHQNTNSTSIDKVDYFYNNLKPRLKNSNNIENHISRLQSKFIQEDESENSFSFSTIINNNFLKDLGKTKDKINNNKKAIEHIFALIYLGLLIFMFTLCYCLNRDREQSMNEEEIFIDEKTIKA